MRGLFKIIITIFIILVALNMFLPRYELVPVGQGVVKYNKVTGKAWRLNLRDGIWEQLKNEEKK